MALTPDISAGARSGADDPQCGVVITGLGVVSPIGIGAEAYWNALQEQRSGVGTLAERAKIRLPLSIGAAVDGFDPKQYVKPRKALKVMCREIQMGFAAASAAVDQARLDNSPVAPERYGVLFGSEMFYCDPAEMQEVYERCIEAGEFRLNRWGEAAMAKMYPLWMLMYLPNMIACHVGIAQDARGPNNTICQGDVSSMLALIEAASIIRRGQADAMIAGGSSSRIGVAPSLYRGMSHLSRRVDAPAQACRPFDATRDGTVNGEGSAAFVLEREDFARAREYPILARLRGWGLSFGQQANGEASHESAIARSIEQALANAAIGPDQVGHVNAHAGGLVDADAVEARAIERVLGDVPVTAPKSFFGDLGSGGGAVEMVASVLALVHKQIPITLNYSQPDPTCPVQVVHSQAKCLEHPTAVVLSQAQTGQAVAVALDAG